MQASCILSKNVSDWYNSLSLQERKKLDGAIEWVVKDLASDAATMVTGLPVGPLVHKVLDMVWEHEHTPEAKEYVTGELKKRLNHKHVLS